MAEVVIVGGGVAGLGSALALARHGHAVTVLERDATPLPEDPDAAFGWDRRGAPQVRHSHAFLARLRNLLRDQHPDVLASLLAAGATEVRFCDLLPDTMEDREPRPGDDDLVALACRRTTFEWVLRRAVMAEPGVRLLDGVVVAGLELATGDTPGSTPRVTGVRTAPVADHGEARTLPADVVVAAVGRRSGLPRWLAEHGIELESVEEDTGIVYLSRFYRLHDGAERPEVAGPIGGDIGYLKYAVFEGDNRTFSVTFAVATDDQELRAALLDPDVFDVAARLLPATAPWAEADRAEAITEVHVMGGLLNRTVRFLDDGGAPLVLGLHAVGDAHTCTNPLYGRGCSLGVVMGALLADALAAHPDDPAAASKAYEAACEAEVLPWYRAAVAQDQLARQEAERAAAARAAGLPDSPPERPAGADEGLGGPGAMRDLLRDGLLPAVRTDAQVFRAFLRSFNLLDPPERLLGDPEVMGKVLAAYQARHERPPEPPLGPRRSEMVAALSRRPRPA